MLLRTSLYLLPGLAFSLSSGTAIAQGQTPYPKTTPVESLTADPVQGGALSEYVDTPGQTSGSSRGTAGHAPNLSREAGRQRPQAKPDIDAIDTSTMPPPAPIQELAVQSENGVYWLCGGIGQQEAEYMKKEARRYDMMLTFAARNGSYLADVDVGIVDGNGRALLQTRCAGPIMLVDLPERGNYRIRAEAENYTVSRTVHITEGQGAYRHVVMTWPAAEMAGQSRDGSVRSSGR